jgi:hypothetical protein
MAYPAGRHTWRGKKAMLRKKLLFFLSPLFFSACISSSPVPVKETEVPVPVEETVVLKDSFPLGDELVFIGVSGIFSKREDSIRYALEDAARRLVFFQSVGGEIIQNEYIGPGAFDYKNDNQGKLFYDEDITKYIEQLQFDPGTDVFEENRTIFVRAYYRASHKLPVGSGYISQKERPFWVDDPPSQIEGFLTGVGYAVPQGAHKDTIIKSYENAVYAIIKTLSDELHSEQETYENSASAFGFYISTENKIVSQATLKNFYILESWADPATRAVWTLAIAVPEPVSAPD